MVIIKGPPSHATRTHSQSLYILIRFFSPIIIIIFFSFDDASSYVLAVSFVFGAIFSLTIYLFTLQLNFPPAQFLCSAWNRMCVCVGVFVCYFSISFILFCTYFQKPLYITESIMFPIRIFKVQFHACPISDKKCAQLFHEKRKKRKKSKP